MQAYCGVFEQLQLQRQVELASFFSQTRYSKMNVEGVNRESFDTVVELSGLEASAVGADLRSSLQRRLDEGTTRLYMRYTFRVADGALLFVTQDINTAGMNSSFTIGFEQLNIPVEIQAPDPATVTTA